MQKNEESFGAAVRRRREKTGLSQGSFAEIVGIHRTYVSSIERGKVSISIGIAAQLAAALETPLSRIWRGMERQARAGSDAP